MQSQRSIEYITDVLIIGSGAAGLSLALHLSGHCKIILISKGPLNECSTLYAQGGIAAVFDESDSIEYHVEDTLIAGAGICNTEIVYFTVKNASKCIKWLIDQGVLFDTEDIPEKRYNYHLTREGGHSHRRILHVADSTGQVIESTLVRKVLNNTDIHVMECCQAIDLVTSNKMDISGTNSVVGAYIWNIDKQRIELCLARTVVLATGGASKVYQYTTNPDISSGDGIAMAWRVGCRVANMEFNQFHPTCLYHSQARNFLLTEALRGEGAYLLRPDGSRFMQDFDSRGELAPRDIVARVIDHEMKRLKTNCMYLDISHMTKEFISDHFPNIYKKLLNINIDITKQPIPIVPAAHYTCGGVIVNKNGCTDLDGLYAIGEVSYTGLHGANRLASNSLLECIVYGWSAAKDILCRLQKVTLTYPYNISLPLWKIGKLPYEEKCIIQKHLHELRLLMWDYVGIVRTTKQLEQALQRIEILSHDIEEWYCKFSMSSNLLELRNMAQVAELIVKSALQRQESRGLHFNNDYPFLLPNPQLTILKP